MRCVALVALLACASAAGCLLGTDGLTGGLAGDMDRDAAAGRFEAGDEAGLDAATTAGAPNLLSNGDFEIGCGGWTASIGQLSDSTEARAGIRSCQLCVGPGSTLVRFSQRVYRTITPGESFVAEVWLRRAPAARPPDTSSTQIVLYADAGVSESSAETAGPGVGDIWQRSSGFFRTTSGGDSVVVVLSFLLNDACVLIDDARLFVER